MKDIEKYISDNKDLFNNAEPSIGHFNRFKEKLEYKKENKFKIILKTSYKYAAVVAILLSSFFIYDNISNKNNSFVADNSTNNFNNESNETFAYYSNIIETKCEKLDQLSCKNVSTQKNNVKNEINSLEQAYNELKVEYDENPDSIIIHKAIISNYQMRINLLDMVINKLVTYC